VVPPCTLVRQTAFAVAAGIVFLLFCVAESQAAACSGGPKSDSLSLSGAHDIPLDPCCGQLPVSSTSPTDGSDGEEPSDGHCCPDDCTDCVLPCCGGVLLVHPACETVSELMMTGPVARSGLILARLPKPSDIFHPPRS
jgi:hypothetical protein